MSRIPIAGLGELLDGIADLVDLGIEARRDPVGAMRRAKIIFGRTVADDLDADGLPRAIPSPGTIRGFCGRGGRVGDHDADVFRALHRAGRLSPAHVDALRSVGVLPATSPASTRRPRRGELVTVRAPDVEAAGDVISERTSRRPRR